MKTLHKALLTWVAAIAMGSMSATAGAHDRHGHGHGRHGHGHHHDRGYVARYYDPPRYVVRERVVERPVYVAPAPAYYYPPVRHPGLVVSVDIPPIVIPLR